MTDPVTAARTARENLARGLAILQSPGVPPHLLDVAEPVAQAMGALHRIESSAGGASAEQAPLALDAVRRALSQLQASSGVHPAVDQAMEAVAGSLGLVHSLTQVAPAAAPALGGTVAMSPGAPQYQQPAPQAAPQYQQPAPQAAPQYQQPAPQAAPQYQQPAPQYQQPAPQYQQPAPQAAPQYQQPAPQAAPQYQQQQPYGAQPAQQPAYAAQPQAAAYPPQQPAAAYGPPPAAAAPPWGQQPQAPAGSWPQHAPPQQQAPSAPAHAAPAPPGAAPGVNVPPGTPHVDADLGAHSPSNFYKGLSGNDVIECGGIFIATYKIPKIGTNLAIKVSLPGGYEFEALGVVEWVREAPNSMAGGMEAPPGFGAKFTQISPEGRQLVYRYVRNREPLFHDDL